ncbi:hypothetical protein [Clostridium sp. Marseille-Q7071]
MKKNKRNKIILTKGGTMPRLPERRRKEKQTFARAINFKVQTQIYDKCTGRSIYTP